MTTSKFNIDFTRDMGEIEKQLCQAAAAQGDTGFDHPFRGPIAGGNITLATPEGIEPPTLSSED